MLAIKTAATSPHIFIHSIKFCATKDNLGLNAGIDNRIEQHSNPLETSVTRVNNKKNAFLLLCHLITLFLFPSVSFGAEIRGRVQDQNGAAIAHARLEFHSHDRQETTYTDPEGDFNIPITEERWTLIVTAPGFKSTTLQDRAITSQAVITLQVAGLAGTVIVTGEPNPTPLDQTAANVAVLSPAELTNQAAVTLDDALRQVPGFTLFRRSSSLTANPTTQGASSRGVGASGASRMLVLADGIPLNDPFGGWVHWDRVPRISLERAEVLRGGGSALYGSGTLGGTVELLTGKPTRAATFELSGNSLHGGDFQAQLARSFGKWNMESTGEWSCNEGAFVVAGKNRGLADTLATLNFGNGSFQLDRQIGEQQHVFVGGSIFAESRNNGTALQVNSTHLGEIDSGADLKLGANDLSFRLYGTGEHYHQSFSSIASDRSSETLTRWQTAPSDQAGFSAQWSRMVSVLRLSAGFDGRFIHGVSDDTVFTNNLPSGMVSAGGRDDALGMYGELSAPISRRLRFSAGARVDQWSNTDGFQNTSTLPSGPIVSDLLAPHHETAVNPRAGAVYDLGPRWQFTASIYKGFRAPTLNELYRTFRLGNVVTLANSDLMAEHLTGGETGIRFVNKNMMLNVAFFDEHVDNPVANVTQNTTPALITRQRQNMGSLRAIGTDIDALVSLKQIQLRTGYEYTHSVVTSFSAEPDLTGRFVSQVPAHSGTFSAIYEGPQHWTIVALVRAASRQFDDDLNEFPLAGYSEVGVSVSKRIGMVSYFASAANLLDARIATAATPVVTYSSPRMMSGGARISLGR